MKGFEHAFVSALAFPGGIECVVGGVVGEGVKVVADYVLVKKA